MADLQNEVQRLAAHAQNVESNAGQVKEESEKEIQQVIYYNIQGDLLQCTYICTVCFNLCML